MKNCLHYLTWHDGIELLDVSFCGRPFGRHSHDAFAIGVIEEGVGGYFHRGASQVLPARNLSLMNPDELHDGYAVSASLKYKMLYVSETSMKQLLGVEALHGFHTHTGADSNGQIISAITEIFRRLETKPHAGFRLALDSALSSVIQSIMERHSKNRVRQLGTETRAVRQTKKFLDSIELGRAGQFATDLAKSITLADLAAMVNLSPNYLLNTFTRQVGVPPYNYWMARRVGAAKQMLAGGLAIQRVAQDLGFCDQAHFSRVFKRMTGVTPGALIVH